MKKSLVILIFHISIFYINAREKQWNFPLSTPKVVSHSIYTLKEIESIRNPMPPQYIYYYDWENYATNKKIIRKGILFTYRNLIAKKVFLSGNFSNWKPILMKRNQFGVFYIIFPIVFQHNTTITTYTYQFNVDGIWILDPSNPNIKHLDSKEVSVFFYYDEEKHHLAKTEIISKKRTVLNQTLFLVEFKIHEHQLFRILNKQHIHTVSVVGDFNYWGTQAMVMKKDSKGIYRYKTYLTEGIHFYNFVVDGEWILDPLNENTRYLANFKKLFNYIELKE